MQIKWSLLNGFIAIFQVLAGGSLDVDVTVTGPNNHVVYKEVRKEYDTIAFNTTVSVNGKQRQSDTFRCIL